MSEELEHHGVLGMHWGIRRQARKNSTLIGREMLARQSYVTREITESEYKSLSSAPIKLGTDFHRISDKNGTLRDFVYVTNNENDRNRYKAFFGGGGNTKNVNKNKYEATIKTNKEVVSPSLKGRIDAYVKVLDSNVIDPKTHQTVKARDWAFGVNDAIRALSTRELGLKTYQTFSQTAHANTLIHSAYFEEIRKQGYNALLDDADREFFAKTPIIIFPENSGAHVTELKPVTKEDILQAKIDSKLLG